MGGASKDKSLRRDYPKAGLYTKHDSQKPLWTIDWYSFEVYLSSDGKHVVQIGPWPRLMGDRKLEMGDPALQELAIAFYEEGEVLQDYVIEDLIKDPQKLPKSVSHFEWEKDISFDDTNDRISLVTVDDQEFIFDIHTGEILEHLAVSD